MTTEPFARGCGRSGTEIAAYRDIINENILERGWDPVLQGMFDALGWVLGRDDGRDAIGKALATPDDVRRRRWIAEGGRPAGWDEK